MQHSVRPIGRIRTPFAEPAGMPIQPRYADGAAGRIEVEADFQAGLRDLDGFSRLWALYLFHRSEGFRLTVTPYLDDRPRGLFATRAPKRPNPIGLSCYRVVSIEDGTIHVLDVDVLDKTPLLDLKPYVPDFDAWPQARAGWVDEVRGKKRHGRADSRFHE